jgi:AcrR family transcriptional regulator
MSIPKTKKPAQRSIRSAGRPRTLELNDILDTALELGLAGLSIGAVAEKLGVAVGTIYNYISGREELIRLAAARHSKRPVVADTGQSWPDLIRSHGRRAFELLVSEPQLLVQYIQGGMGPQAHLDYIESVLAALVQRGLTVSEAFRLYTCVDAIAFGAAVRTANTNALENQPHGYSGAIRRSLAEYADDDLPTIRGCAEFTRPTEPYAFEESLERLIASFSKSRRRPRRKL